MEYCQVQKPYQHWYWHVIFELLLWWWPVVEYGENLVPWGRPLWNHLWWTLTWIVHLVCLQVPKTWTQCTPQPSKQHPIYEAIFNVHFRICVHPSNPYRITNLSTTSLISIQITNLCRLHDYSMSNLRTNFAYL